jgi:acetyltransferase-like isoleucine patch superfamily enzyme
VAGLRSLALRSRLRAELLRNRIRLRWVRWLNPGLEIHPEASPNFGRARFNLAPGARLRIGPRVATEAREGALHFVLGPGATVEIAEDAWLRTEVGDTFVVAFEGAVLRIGPEAFLNGCHVSAKGRVELGRRAWLGPGTRVFDADQHDFDDARPERISHVTIGDHVWVAGDVTILRGVTIGDHSIVGARSVVLEDVPPHTLVVGAPAKPVGTVGDRSRAR